MNFLNTKFDWDDSITASSRDLVGARVYPRTEWTPISRGQSFKGDAWKANKFPVATYSIFIIFIISTFSGKGVKFLAIKLYK